MTDTGMRYLRVMEELDKGRLRVASPSPSGGWVVNEWVKQTILLYFALQRMKTWELEPFEWYDKMELKKNYAGSRGAGRAAFGRALWSFPRRETSC